jgi:2-octaprenyl-6-methoxyphenol hydroxylase
MSMDFDILIIGGGVVGASLARAISGQGFRIGVVEAHHYNSDSQPSYDERILALSWGSRLILQGMGLWRKLEPVVQPILDVHISDRGHFGFARLNHLDEGVEALGYVVSSRALGGVLFDGLGDLQDVELLCPASLNSFTLNQAEVEVRLHGSNEPLSASLLVGADGGQSLVRKLLGISCRVSSYGQTAIIANVTPERPHRGVAYERFTDSGPLALLPMTGGDCSLVWTARDDQVGALMAMDELEFLRGLQDRFGYRLGRFLKVGKRSAYPLRLMQVMDQVRSRVALIGNAAHTLHPVTGQGFNLGIRDVAALADVLSDVRRDGADPGAIEVLKRYADWRKTDQNRVALITDSLARLFANPLSPLRMARNLGLVGLDLMPPLKHLTARQFMGMNGRLPRLARGIPIA